MEISLEEFTEEAKRAYYWTSMSPDRRGNQMVKEYTEVLLRDIQEIENATTEEKEEYIKHFKKRFSEWLSAKSKCASSMITGPANFPVEKNRRANDREHKVGNDFNSHREYWIKRIKKNIQNRKPESQKHDEEWELIEKGILSSAATVVNYDLGIDRMYTRALFVNSIVKKVETLAKNGKVSLVERSTDLITRLNEQNKKPIISDKHKFWGLLEKARLVVEQRGYTASKEDKEYLYVGFKVVICYKDDRIRIVHYEKPERSVIDEIKSHGFRWSPYNTAWQRKITNNAMYVTFKLLLKDVEPIKQEA